MRFRFGSANEPAAQGERTEKSLAKRPITEAEMEAARMHAGGWSARQLRSWGVLSPPPRGWRRRLLRSGVPLACPYPGGFEPSEPAATEIARNPLLDFARESAASIALPGVVEIFADGSCSPNPGTGGWGFAAYRNGMEVSCGRGGEVATTNNRMELRAAIAALDWLEPAEAAILWTDSQYVARGCLEWRHGWRKANWTRSQARPPANADLWAMLGKLLDTRTVEVRWARGHRGTIGNERADGLANEGRRGALR